MSARIIGTGSCLPSLVVDNRKLEEIVDTDEKQRYSFNEEPNRNREPSYSGGGDHHIHGNCGGAGSP